jgi:carbamoyl-phosphate synthase large subunit
MPTDWIHVLGGGEWQLPTISLARSMGYRVLCTDMYEERPGYELADAHHRVDITDREGTLRVARDYDIGGIVCDTTDAGVRTMAFVAAELGLSGISSEVAARFTNKHLMREVTAAAGIPSPAFDLLRDLDDADRVAKRIGFPLVTKPIANQSSRGVRIVRSAAELEAAVAEAARFSGGEGILVEGFLDGVEVTVEGFCIDGEPYVAGISDKSHFAHRPEVASRLTYPADAPPATLETIRATNHAVVQALGMETGITHAEYMVVGDTVYLVEIAARGGGSRVYSHIAPYLAGAPIAEFYLKRVMGEAMDIRPDGRARAANLAFFDIRPGTVRSIAGLEEARVIPGVQEILLELAVGDVVGEPQDDRSRVGQVVVFGSARSEVMATTQAVFDMVEVVTA